MRPLTRSLRRVELLEAVDDARARLRCRRAACRRCCRGRGSRAAAESGRRSRGSRARAPSAAPSPLRCGRSRGRRASSPRPPSGSRPRDSAIRSGDGRRCRRDRRGAATRRRTRRLRPSGGRSRHDTARATPARRASARRRPGAETGQRSRARARADAESACGDSSADNEPSLMARPTELAVRNTGSRRAAVGGPEHHRRTDRAVRRAARRPVGLAPALRHLVRRRRAPDQGSRLGERHVHQRASDQGVDRRAPAI